MSELVSVLDPDIDMVKVMNLWALVVAALVQLDAYKGNRFNANEDRATQTFSHISHRPDVGSTGSESSANMATGDLKHLSDSWHEGGPSVNENEIDSSSDQTFHRPKPNYNQNQNQNEYTCGRAVSSNSNNNNNNRYREYDRSRSKYRPNIEIRMPRIIGGDETEPGEFPWTASIKLNNQPICGGSLIDRSWILTAAHCVVGYDPKNLTVRLGAYRIKDQGELQALEVPVSMFIVHREYSVPRPFSNDIALLKLDDPIRYNDHIIPICLPYEDQVTTSTSSISVNDYSNVFDTSREADDTGIVVSTKMSDIEIAKCFKRLEQNYLNSIGLGLSTEAHQMSSASPIRVQITTPVPMSVNSNKNDQQQANQQQLAFSYNDLFNSILMPIKEQTNKLNLFAPTTGSNKLYNHNLNNQQEYVGENASPMISNHQNIYFDNSWSERNQDKRKKNINLEPRKESNIKLSRLPLNNELIKEIQSIGSNSLPSLNLGVQREDIVAMASDLIHNVNAASQSPQNVLSSPYREKITSSTEVENNMEQQQQQQAAYNRLQQQQYQRQRLPEDSLMGNYLKDDPTRYSGLNGIVVGWGWIRELDGEEQVSTKGMQSVTLQKVKLPILRNRVCESWFQSQSKKITLLPSQFCAGFQSGGKDACRVS